MRPRSPLGSNSVLEKDMPPGSLAAATNEAAPGVAMQPAQAGRPLVCHVASGDLWAGAESQLASLLQGLARRGEFRLCAILSNEGRLAEEVRRCGVELKVIPESTTSFRETVRAACQYLGKKETRIVHSHGYKSNLLAAWIARRCHIPIVVRTQHGMPEPFRGMRGLKQSALQLADRAIARWSTDGVIAVSEDMRAQLGPAVGHHKVITIPN